MLTTVQSYLRLCKPILHRWRTDPGIQKGIRIVGCVLSGFLLSAASLGNRPMPLPLGLILSLSGWQAVLVAVGSVAGYLVFWGRAGALCLLCAGVGLVCVPVLNALPLSRRYEALPCVLAGLICALGGLSFQRMDGAPPLIYLVRVALAMASTRLFTLVQQRQDSVARWPVWGLTVLALAQVAPLPWLSLGFPVASALTVASAFPAAALAGLALDLARVTPVPMTAVLCGAWLLRLLPAQRRWYRALGPALVYLVLMALVGKTEFAPLPGLLLGGLAVFWQPGAAAPVRRRGEVGVAQVRLELASGVFSRMEQLLLETSPAPIDREALIQKACQRACGGCPARKGCPSQESAQGLSAQLLELPLMDHSLPFSCRRSGRLLQELRRAQEQLRLLRGSQNRQKEYRAAVVQQYRFMTEYLQTLSDELARKETVTAQRYQPEVAFCGNRAAVDNGDRCMRFSGTGCRYYVLLSDGMGKGVGAADEAASAAATVRQLLQAGLPARHALSTYNSLCALRGQAGAATVDLAELQLDTGRVLLYKWGAASSWVLRESGSEKIGTAGPPPGVSVADDPETALRLSLRRGEILVLLSDGVGGEDALHGFAANGTEPLGELAARILESGDRSEGDDATVALIRLRTPDLAT